MDEQYRKIKSPRVLVCGGRDYDDYDTMLNCLVCLRNPTIVHGAAKGADLLAEKVAKELGYTTEPHPANWELQGKAAGPIRNQWMADSGIDWAIVFPGGKGTKDMMIRLFDNNIPFTYVGGKK